MTRMELDQFRRELDTWLRRQEEQIRRFGKEVLPRLQAHQVRRVPAAETVPA